MKVPLGLSIPKKFPIQNSEASFALFLWLYKIGVCPWDEESVILINESRLVKTDFASHGFIPW